MRKLLATMVASVVVAAAGVSLAGGGGPELPLRVTQFEAAANVLHGTIPGGAAAEFGVGPGTIFGPGGDPKLLPPGPCRAIATEWNVLAKTGHLNLQTARVMFEVMAAFKCSVAVGLPQTNPTGNVPLAVSIRPDTN